MIRTKRFTEYLSRYGYCHVDGIFVFYFDLSGGNIFIKLGSIISKAVEGYYGIEGIKKGARILLLFFRAAGK